MLLRQSIHTAFILQWRMERHIDIERQKIDCLRFVMCLPLAPVFQGFFMQPLTILMKQTRQVVRAIKPSIYLDVYGMAHFLIVTDDRGITDKVSNTCNAV